MFPRGDVYIVNKIGPSTEPWGTPYFNVTCVDVQNPIWTVCVRSLRYDSNHLRAYLLFQKDWFNRYKNFWWSMVSNAALKSSNTKMAPPSLSTAWSRSFVHEAVLSLCCEIVCKHTKISHISCWFSNALLIEHKQRVPQALEWKIDQTQACSS